jgi:clathrin heavy chain
LQLAALEKQVKEHSKKDQSREQQEAEQPIINPGGFGTARMITAGPG